MNVARGGRPAPVTQIGLYLRHDFVPVKIPDDDQRRFGGGKTGLEVADKLLAADGLQGRLCAVGGMAVDRVRTVNDGTSGSLGDGRGIVGHAPEVGQLLLAHPVQLPLREGRVLDDVGHYLQHLGPMGGQRLTGQRHVLAARVAVEL